MDEQSFFEGCCLTSSFLSPQAGSLPPTKETMSDHNGRRLPTWRNRQSRRNINKRDKRDPKKLPQARNCILLLLNLATVGSQRKAMFDSLLHKPTNTLPDSHPASALLSRSPYENIPCNPFLHLHRNNVSPQQLLLPRLPDPKHHKLTHRRRTPPSQENHFRNRALPLPLRRRDQTPPRHNSGLGPRRIAEPSKRHTLLQRQPHPRHRQHPTSVVVVVPQNRRRAVEGRTGDIDAALQRAPARPSRRGQGRVRPAARRLARSRIRPVLPRQGGAGWQDRRQGVRAQHVVAERVGRGRRRLRVRGDVGEVRGRGRRGRGGCQGEDGGREEEVEG